MEEPLQNTSLASVASYSFPHMYLEVEIEQRDFGEITKTRLTKLENEPKTDNLSKGQLFLKGTKTYLSSISCVSYPIQVPIDSITKINTQCCLKLDQT